MQRAQDDRDVFSPEELQLIFSQDWFVNGKCEFGKTGWTTWRPHYYWLPLIAILSGARLNELSQLYLDDIVQTETDKEIWYFDFNLNQPDKTEETDKSLKTANSIRVVPLHPLLIKLGLPEYVAALRKAGYVRLFPELKRDEVKGYGKPAGSWFNERFLGERLKIERNGKKTFHSLRHGFLTAAERLDIPERVINQISGHQRGETQSSTRYMKDRSAVELQGVINQFHFPCLDSLSPFKVPPALQSLKVSAQHKESMARSKRTAASK